MEQIFFQLAANIFPRDRVHRLVARALLYSSVSPDTRVYASLARPEVTINST